MGPTRIYPTSNAVGVNPQDVICIRLHVFVHFPLPYLHVLIILYLLLDCFNQFLYFSYFLFRYALVVNLLRDLHTCLGRAICALLR